MKKPVLAAVLALAITAGATAPAHAGTVDGRDFLIWQRSSPVAVLIGLLLPAVQKAF